MQKFMEKMEAIMTPLATKVGANRILKAVSMAFNLIMPIIIIGAIFSLVTTMQIGPYQEFLTSSGLAPLLALVSKFTTDCLALYVSFTTAYAYVRNEGMSGDAIPAGLLSVLSFLIMTPLANVVVNEVPTTFISFDFLGSKGLFTALIVGMLVGIIYTFIVKRGWVIKMPDGVPPTVSKSFSALIPGFAITIIFIAINAIFSSVAETTFSEWIYSMLSIPLSALSGSLVAYMILGFAASVFWFFGIHGGQVVMPFAFILFMQAGAENQAALAAGQPMANILTMGLFSYLMLGGIGATIGLSINMLLFSKSERYKALGKIAILPSWCGINEPIVFGMPLILNPVMAIPFFIMPLIASSLTYFVMKIGLVALPQIAMGALGTPLLFDGWLICGITGVLLQIVIVIISMLVYYPFFKVQDNIACKEEQAAVTEI